MSNFLEKIDLKDFTLGALDTSEIDDISNWFPRNAVVDLNIAEEGMILSLHGQNRCQEIVARIDVWIGYKESEKNRAWLEAVTEAGKSGYRTAKDKEWYAQAYDKYIDAMNEVTIAKAAKKFFENKASYFSSWHYAFKTFLNRDYSLERLGNLQGAGYNVKYPASRKPDQQEKTEATEWCGEEDEIWK